jgi:hypothetical protein
MPRDNRSLYRVQYNRTKGLVLSISVLVTPQDTFPSNSCCQLQYKSNFGMPRDRPNCFIWPRDPYLNRKGACPSNSKWNRVRDCVTGRGPTSSLGVWNLSTIAHTSRSGPCGDGTLVPEDCQESCAQSSYDDDRYDFRTRRYRPWSSHMWSDVEYCKDGRHRYPVVWQDVFYQQHWTDPRAYPCCNCGYTIRSMEDGLIESTFVRTCLWRDGGSRYWWSVQRIQDTQSGCRIRQLGWFVPIFACSRFLATANCRESSKILLHFSHLRLFKPA